MLGVDAGLSAAAWIRCVLREASGRVGWEGVRGDLGGGSVDAWISMSTTGGCKACLLWGALQGQDTWWKINVTNGQIQDFFLYGGERMKKWKGVFP